MSRRRRRGHGANLAGAAAALALVVVPSARDHLAHGYAQLATGVGNGIAHMVTDRLLNAPEVANPATPPTPIRPATTAPPPTE